MHQETSTNGGRSRLGAGPGGGISAYVSAKSGPRENGWIWGHANPGTIVTAEIDSISFPIPGNGTPSRRAYCNQFRFLSHENTKIDLHPS
jgi:hypothetical protein